MSHWYAKDGTLVDPQIEGSLLSVTTILDVRANPGLQAWRDHVGAEAADERGKIATDRGTLVHESIEEYGKYLYKWDDKMLEMRHTDDPHN